MNIAKFLEVLNGKCTQIYNLRIRKMYDSVQTTGISALPVHSYTHFSGNTRLSPIIAS